jgi:hypothetical protein
MSGKTKLRSTNPTGLLLFTCENTRNFLKNNYGDCMRGFFFKECTIFFEAD